MVDRGKAGSQSWKWCVKKQDKWKEKGLKGERKTNSGSGRGKQKEVEAENLGGNNSVPLLATRLQSGEQTEGNIDIPFFSLPCSFLIVACCHSRCAMLFFFFFVVFQSLRLFNHTYFNIPFSFCISYFAKRLWPSPTPLCPNASSLSLSCSAFKLLMCTVFFVWNLKLWTSIDLMCLQTV